MSIDIFKNIITNILSSFYQSFGFSTLLGFFFMFFYMLANGKYQTEKGWKQTLLLWWEQFKMSKEFRHVFYLAVYTSMILFRTLLNRSLWMNLLSDVMGNWTVYQYDSASGDAVLSTECLENILMFVPFSILWSYYFKLKEYDLKRNIPSFITRSTALVLCISFTIEVLQILLRVGTFQFSDIFYNTWWYNRFSDVLFMGTFS